MSSLKLDHSKMFKIHYYSNDMTVLEVSLNDEFSKDSVDLTQSNNTQTATDTSDGESTDTEKHLSQMEKKVLLPQNRIMPDFMKGM